MRTLPGRVLGTAVASLLLLGAAPHAVEAQEADREAKIDRAMAAAPASVAREATIRDAEGSLLREGSNGWTCFSEIAPEYGYPMCGDQVWLELREALLNQADFSTDRVGLSYMLAGDAGVNNADPYDKKKDEGEVWVKEGPHLMIIVPDPSMLEGVPSDPHRGGPYVMWGGTPYAHIMVPVAPRPEQEQ